MPLTIAQIMSVSYPTIARELGVDYRFGQILDGPDGTMRGAIYTSDGRHASLFSYAHNEELRMRTERERIQFAASLLHSGIQTLRRAVADNAVGYSVPDEVAIDVDFSED